MESMAAQMRSLHRGSEDRQKEAGPRLTKLLDLPVRWRSETSRKRVGIAPMACFDGPIPGMLD